MRVRQLLIVCVVALASVNAGCTNVFLRRNAVRQTDTIMDVFYQQVVNNLAGSCENPDVLPHFAILGDGTTQATDQSTPTGGLQWNAHTITQESLGINANRQLMENWKLSPVCTPGRLMRMRCALQFVISPPTIAVEPVIDPTGKSPTRYAIAEDKCTRCISEMVKMGLLPKPSPSHKGTIESKDGAYLFSDNEDANNYATAISANLNCHFPSGWFCRSCKEKPPKCACYSARCGHTSVWVMPDGIDGLSRFTVTMLTLATIDPQSSSVTVTRKLTDSLGRQVTVQGQASGDVMSFEMPTVKTTKALQDAAKNLLDTTKRLATTVLSDEKNMKAFGPSVGAQEVANRFDELNQVLETISSQPEVSRADIAKLRALLKPEKDENKNFFAPLANHFSPKETNAVIDALPTSDFYPPSPAPNVMDLPGYMPFSHPTSGAEFVPAASQ